jgi:hypothetical protein
VRALNIIELILIICAERLVGEMLIAAKAAGQITHAHKGLVVEGEDNKVKLNNVGISRDLSSRGPKAYQVTLSLSAFQLAKVPQKVLCGLPRLFERFSRLNWLIWALTTAEP